VITDYLIAGLVEHLKCC